MREKRQKCEENGKNLQKFDFSVEMFRQTKQHTQLTKTLTNSHKLSQTLTNSQQWHASNLRKL